MTEPLFVPDESVTAQRLRLSAATTADLEPMRDWLPTSALSPDWQLEDLEAQVEAGHAVLITDVEGSTIGLAVVLNDAPDDGAASIALLTIAPQRRFVGLGGEAALALERHVRARWGLERVYAPVPDGRGLAVYFWLRQGYRPLQTPEAPWPLAGLSPEPRPGIWMLRETA